MSKPHHLPRNVLVLTLTSLFTDISSEMLINVLPLFWANGLGVRTSLIGLIEDITETAGPHRNKLKMKKFFIQASWVLHVGVLRLYLESDAFFHTKQIHLLIN